MGRLIIFKKDEIDAFMDKRRVECFDIKKEAERILRGATNSRIEIDRVIKKAIERSKKKEYTVSHGKSDQIKGLRKEVQDGTL